jgi:O-antigen ligase
VSVAAGRVGALPGAVPRIVARAPVLDTLLFATVFTITFARVRWTAGAADVNLSDILAALFVAVFAAERMGARDRLVPRAALAVVGFGLAFSAVYLAGFFNLQTTQDLELFAKGMVKFAIHFAFLACGITHLARRAPRFYWLTLGWFVAGVAANAAYGVVELAYAEATGGNLDQVVLTPLTGEVRGGINVYGAVGGANVYRTNALMLDPNHLGIVLAAALVILLPVYLRLGRGHGLRAPLALLLGFLLVVELATLSRSGLLGLGAGLLVLAIPYRRFALSSRLLVPLALAAIVVGAVVAQRSGFFEEVFRSRTQLSGGSTRVHLDLYELVPPVIDLHPTFGLGLNTFSSYYEFVTGEDNWGPHSYYIAVLAETGIVGAALFLAWIVYLFRRLGALRELGRRLAAAGDPASVQVRPLAWGLTAALVGTLGANAFYLTMQMYYFVVFALLVLAAPVVFAADARRRGIRAAPTAGPPTRVGGPRTRRDPPASRLTG